MILCDNSLPHCAMRKLNHCHRVNKQFAKSLPWPMRTHHYPFWVRMLLKLTTVYVRYDRFIRIPRPNTQNNVSHGFILALNRWSGHD